MTQREKTKEARILLTEDDPNLGLILHENLEQHGFEVELCRDGEEARTAFLTGRYNLCLIDVMLPKKDGFTLAQDIRKVDAGVPIMFITAKSLKEDRIKGFRVGADDYIVKPFSMEELILRIRAILKRTEPATAQKKMHGKFRVGQYEFDADTQLLNHGKTERKLTHKETELMKLLCQHQNQILERELALKLIWGDDTVFNARSMDVFITRLRKYLNEDDRIEIVNVHGRGFKLVVRGD